MKGHVSPEIHEHVSKVARRFRIEHLVDESCKVLKVDAETLFNLIRITLQGHYRESILIAQAQKFSEEGLVDPFIEVVLVEISDGQLVISPLL